MFRAFKKLLCVLVICHTYALVRPCVQMAFFALLERILVFALPLGQTHLVLSNERGRW